MLTLNSIQAEMPVEFMETPQCLDGSRGSLAPQLRIPRRRMRTCQCNIIKFSPAENFEKSTASKRIQALIAVTPIGAA